MDMEQKYLIAPPIKKQEPDNAIPFMYKNELIKEFCEIRSRIGKSGYNEMSNFAYNNIHKILDLCILDNKSNIGTSIIADTDFLIGLDTINDLEFNNDYLIKFNRVARSYLLLPSENKMYRRKSARLFLDIAYTVNKQMVDILMSIDLPYKVALWLTINRYSSTDERKSIRRLTREIQHQSIVLMTPQMVVDIYSKTCSDCMTTLFCSVMTDRFESFLDEDENLIYSIVSNSLLDILETMSYEDIEYILTEYITEISRNHIRGRFYLNGINYGDYPRINNVLEKLDSMGYEFY
jgi:hypothetical protein